MFVVDRWLGDDDLQFHHLRGADARKALLILSAMTFHSVAEGIAIGVSFSTQGNLGFVISSALAVHNIPEGLTVRYRLALATASHTTRATDCRRSVWRWSRKASPPLMGRFGASSPGRC